MEEERGRGYRVFVEEWESEWEREGHMRARPLLPTIQKTKMNNWPHFKGVEM